MMKRQFGILGAVFVVFFTLSLIFGARVVADLSLSAPILVADEPNTKMVLIPSEAVSAEQISDARQVVFQRLYHLHPDGYHSVIVKNQRLEVELAQHENVHYITDIISRVGEIEFIDGGTQPPIGQYVATKLGPPSDPHVYQTLFTGQDIGQILAPEEGQLFYQIMPDGDAAERIGNFVNEAQANEYICLVVDAQVINCSKMYYWSGGILGVLPNLSSGTGLSLADAAIFLGSGPHPVSFEAVTD